MTRSAHGAILAILLLASPATARGADVAIPARATVVKPGTIAKLVARSGPASFPLPAPGSPEDPTVSGAELRVFDASPFGAGGVAFPLHSSGWRGLGNPSGSSGYVYRGKDDALDDDPKGTCRRIVVKRKTIEAVCKGTAVALEPPFAADAVVQLRLGEGTSALRYCAAAGGTEKKNTEKALRRVGAAAPVSCTEDAPPRCGPDGFGVCPEPFFCAILPPEPTYFCAPTFCSGGTYPSCGGTCGNGWECKPVSIGAGTEYCLCSPPAAPCNAVCGGFDCPGNDICTFDPASGDCGCAAG